MYFACFFTGLTLAHYIGGVGGVVSKPATPTIFQLNDC